MRDYNTFLCTRIIQIIYADKVNLLVSEFPFHTQVSESYLVQE